MAAGLKEEVEKEEMAVRAEKGPTREVFLAHEKEYIKEELRFMKRCHAVVLHTASQ